MIPVRIIGGGLPRSLKRAESSVRRGNENPTGVAPQGDCDLRSGPPADSGTKPARNSAQTTPAGLATRKGPRGSPILWNANPGAVQSVNPRSGLGSRAGTSHGRIRWRVAID